jgi:hypothetical protein
MKVALSQYPRGGSQTRNQPLMGYSIRNDRWWLTLWCNVKTDEIAAMWRFTKNNSITESFHRKMKLIQRRAYGFRNFQNYRLRVIAACGQPFRSPLNQQLNSTFNLQHTPPQTLA